jgi:ketosteroid isomerase-like protein
MLAEQYAEDAISMPPNAPTVRGRKAILAEFEKFFRENEGGHRTDVDEVLTGDGWAIERARYTMHIKPKTGGPEIVETGRHVMCRRKIGGNWLIVWEIWNSEAPPPK